MRVLRIETFAGRTGPYRNIGIKGLGSKVSCDRHPTPCSDPGIREVWNRLKSSEYQAFFCGFKNISQLITWFPRSEWELFYDHNEGAHEARQFGISDYIVDKDDVLIGERQIVFRLDKAERTRFRPFERKPMLRRVLDTIVG